MGSDRERRERSEERRERRRRKEKKKRREREECSSPDSDESPRKKKKSDNEKRKEEDKGATSKVNNEFLQTRDDLLHFREDLVKDIDEKIKNLDEKIKRNQRVSSEPEIIELEKKTKKKKKKEKKKLKEVTGAAEGSKDGRTPMEMLELEMRARAIKALLIKTEPEDVEEVRKENVEAEEEEREEEGSKPGDSHESPILPDGPSKPEPKSLSQAISSLLAARTTCPPGEEREAEPQKDWTHRFNKPIPGGILELCLGGECKICKLEINSQAECQEHYFGARHLRRVAGKLEALFADREGEPIGWRQSLAPKVIPLAKELEEEVKKKEGEEEKKRKAERKAAKLARKQHGLLPPPEDSSRRREPAPPREDLHHQEWAALYDRPMPESVMNLCLDTECKLCGVVLKSELMSKSHYVGKVHAKNVNQELEVIFKATGDPKPLRVAAATKSKNKKQKPHYIAPTLTCEIIAAARQPPPLVDPLSQFNLDEMDENLILGRNLGKRPKYWA